MEKGHLDTAEFKIIADVDTAFMELQAETIDVLNYLTADQVAALNDDFNIVEGNMHLVHAMFLNNDFEPFKDVKVRQAMCYAVDRRGYQRSPFRRQEQAYRLTYDSGAFKVL